jgi:O6-methylguanine-DNA--protein-cysteine methyltransferase
MAADDPRPDHGDWRPVPDPTTLTTEQLRRELSGLREILTARLDGMDRATTLLDETVNRTPTIIQTEISHVRELMTEKLGSLGGQAEEKFSSIQLQFSERDVRTEQAATASASALAAALQAAKEAVFEQAQAAAKAAEKTELSFTKQIDQIQLQIKTIGDGFSDRIAELKERIDRGEGSTTGAETSRSDQRLGTGQLLQVVAVILTMIGLVIVAFHK